MSGGLEVASDRLLKLMNKGVTVEQVAQELGIPTGTAKSRLSRGRRALARWLDPAAEEVATNDG